METTLKTIDLEKHTSNLNDIWTEFLGGDNKLADEESRIAIKKTAKTLSEKIARETERVMIANNENMLNMMSQYLSSQTTTVAGVATQPIPFKFSVPSTPVVASIPVVPSAPIAPVAIQAPLVETDTTITETDKNTLSQIGSETPSLPSVPSLPNDPSLPNVPPLPNVPSLPSVPDMDVEMPPIVSALAALDVTVTSPAMTALVKAARAVTSAKSSADSIASRVESATQANKTAMALVTLKKAKVDKVVKIAQTDQSDRAKQAVEKAKTDLTASIVKSEKAKLLDKMAKIPRK